MDNMNYKKPINQQNKFKKPEQPYNSRFLPDSVVR